MNVYTRTFGDGERRRRRQISIKACACFALSRKFHGGFVAARILEVSGATSISRASGRVCAVSCSYSISHYPGFVCWFYRPVSRSFVIVCYFCRRDVDSAVFVSAVTLLTGCLCRAHPLAHAASSSHRGLFRSLKYRHAIMFTLYGSAYNEF